MAHGAMVVHHVRNHPPPGSSSADDPIRPIREHGTLLASSNGTYLTAVPPPRPSRSAEDYTAFIARYKLGSKVASNFLLCSS
jgi:hypothetical protein